jgi:DHA2 family multidrug resistance protein
MANAGAIRQLWQLTYRQALTMMFSDIFLALMLCFALTTAIVPMMRKVKPPAAPSPDAH